MTIHPRTVVHCGCGAQYTIGQWHRLAFVGLTDAEDPEMILELRNCTCGSTKALELPAPQPRPVGRTKG